MSDQDQRPVQPPQRAGLSGDEAPAKAATAASGSCQLPVESTCDVASRVVSDEEVRILAELRAVKREYLRLRQALASDPDPEPEPDARRESIDALRNRWDRLQAELRQANRDKWIRLGYDPPE